jgi:hypothetical protein
VRTLTRLMIAYAVGLASMTTVGIPAAAQAAPARTMSTCLNNTTNQWRNVCPWKITVAWCVEGPECSGVITRMRNLAPDESFDPGVGANRYQYAVCTGFNTFKPKPYGGFFYDCVGDDS